MLGGAIAVALGVAAPGAVTATAGAVIAAVIVGPALLVGGLSAAALYWRKLKRDAVRELETRLETLRNSYHQAMVDLTHRERTRLLQYGQQILAPVFSQLSVMNERYTQQKAALDEVGERSRKLRAEIDAITIITEE